MWEEQKPAEGGVGVSKVAQVCKKRGAPERTSSTHRLLYSHWKRGTTQGPPALLRGVPEAPPRL